MRNKWWQACKELLGRPGRNILIAICIFVLTLFCGIATFLDSAIESFYKSFADMAGCCVLVELDDFSTLDDWKDILEYADNNKNVVGYNNAFTSDIICEAVDFENVPYTEKQSDFEENKIYVSGNINTSYNEYFSSGIFKISKGKYPMSGDKGAMISDKLASENNLSIGSNVSIQYENNTLSIKVIGIYTVINTPKTQVSDGYYKEVADSIVFTDYNSYVELNNEASCYGINFFSTDYKSTSLLYDDMSKMFQNVPDSAVVNQVLNEELQMTDVISMLKSMTSVTLSVMYKLISPAKNMYDYRFTGSYELPVQFSDIKAEVFIYTGFTIKYYIALMIFDVGFSLMMGIVFVYLRIRKIIAGYQTELEASQEQEKKARQEKDELMRNMAHDLRTPLTGVMTYVDVMKLENEAYAENMKNLNFISEKVLDIRTQVDNLLDFSIAGSQRPIELDASMDVEYIFGDYLSDVCAQLMKSNYEVDAEGISFKQVKVAVNMAFLTRIFSNLTDNIYKYADNKKPVVMKTAFTKKTFSVEIGNGVCDNKTLLKSAGIGLKSVDAMMQRMNGSMSFKREHGKFWVKLEFPIV